MKTFPIIQVGENTTRQVLADHVDLMVVAFSFEITGAEGLLHKHPHIQSTYVKSGRFRFTIDGDTFEVSAGDSFVIPSNAIHGCICIEPGVLVDNFSPRRDDFL
jgi:quercetin dioxygenase-like cupin family protein